MIDRTQAAGLEHARRRNCLPPLLILGAVVALAGYGSSTVPLPEQSVALRTVAAADVPVTEPVASNTAASQAVTLDPWPDLPGGRLSRWAWTQPAQTATPDAVPAPESSAEAPAAVAEAPREAMTVPLPVPRPPELRGTQNPVRRMARVPVRQEAVLPAPPPEDSRSFLEKLFGVEQTPARSYAALETKPVDPTPRPRLSPPLAAPSAEGGTATYDISARIVTLPNGEKLEAHSGLGEIMDDPRHVNVRMRGATPPGTYVLTEREQLFHGVRAIRLTPVGGPDAVYGRVGLLAHTFMLGPTGASNGCVSFRDYNRFLESYLRGEIRQLVVVTGAGFAAPNLADAGRSAIRMARN